MFGLMTVDRHTQEILRQRVDFLEVLLKVSNSSLECIDGVHKRFSELIHLDAEFYDNLKFIKDGIPVVTKNSITQEAGIQAVKMQFDHLLDWYYKRIIEIIDRESEVVDHYNRDWNSARDRVDELTSDSKSPKKESTD